MMRKVVSDLVGAAGEYLERKISENFVGKFRRIIYFTGFDFCDSFFWGGIWYFCDDVFDDVVGESAFFNFL